MDLEEKSIEELGERCQNCGATLTDEEKAVALERGTGVMLCKNCAAEEVPLSEEEGAEELEEGA